MANFYKETFKYLKSNLKQYGFRCAEYNEGLYYSINNETYITFSISGLWSQINIESGIKFDKVNKIIIESAKMTQMNPNIINGFNLKLYGFFSEQMGHYFRDEVSMEDSGKRIDTSHSQVANPEQVMEYIIAETNRLSKIAELSCATSYVMEKKLFSGLGFCMIPAAAKILNNEYLWDWAFDYFSPLVNKGDVLKIFKNVEEYNDLLFVMKNIK